MGAAPFTHHKTFAGNFFDPIGLFGGKNGFLGLGENQNEKRDREAAAAAAESNRSVPSVTAESEDDDPERLKRIGRAQLISSSARGVLSDAETSTRKLFGV